MPGGSRINLKNHRQFPPGGSEYTSHWEAPRSEVVLDTANAFDTGDSMTL